MHQANPLFSLDGKVAIVTGGGAGIGEAIAGLLADLGATTVVIDRDGASAARVAAAVRAKGGRADLEQLDLADEDAVVRGVAGVIARCGPPDILVNNAGVQDRQPLFEISGAEWDRIQRINLRGAFLMIRECAKAMVDGGVRGSIVNIASLGTEHPMIEGLAAYSASKAGLKALTRNAAFELAAHGIRVNAILPGGVVTPGSSHGAARRVEGPGTRPPPFGQLLPADIAGAVAFFVLPLAAKVTGQSLAVDAGWMLT